MRTKYFIGELKQYAVSFVIVFSLFLGTTELIARVFTVSGSFDYIERMIIEQGLKPKKNPGEYRIFLFGESTMHGNHLYPKSTIKRWIELYLENLLGEEKARNVRVVNLARLGVSSDFITEAFEDTCVYKPDLVVFYSVHNDFVQLENRKDFLRPKSWKDATARFFQRLMKKSCFVSAVKRAAVAAKLRQKAKSLPQDDWYPEKERKVYDPEHDLLDPATEDFKKIRDNWENNIRTIVASAKKSHIGLIFFSGLAKYKKYAPFYSVHKKNITGEALLRWQEIDQAAQHQFDAGEYARSADLYKKCLDIDPQYALTYFRLGQSYEALQDFESANRFYKSGNEKDFFPLRAPAVVNAFYQELAQREASVFIIPTQSLFEKHSPQGMVDDGLVLDQIHPTVKGQALMAMEIVQWLYKNNQIAPANAWQWSNLKSVEALSQQLNIDEEFEFKMYLSSAVYVGSYFKEAIGYLNKALEIHPESLAARSHLAWCYWELGEKKKALDLYKKLNQENPAEAEKFFKRHPEIKEMTAK